MRVWWGGFQQMFWEGKRFVVLNVMLEIAFIVRDSTIQTCLQSILEFY